MAIVSASYARAILDGRKTIESRFSRDRRAPWGRVRRGDRVWVKVSGGPVVADCTVRRVIQFADLTADQLADARRQWGALVVAPAAYWNQRRHKRFGVLIWLGKPRPPRQAPRIDRQYGAGWITLTP